MSASRRSFLTTVGAGMLAPMIPTEATADPLPVAENAALSTYTAINAVQTEQPHVALTFDDGPHARLTPRLLDILRDYNAKATFFVVGRRVATWPEVVQRIVEEGHEIGNHSWSHPHLSRYSDAGALSEIDRTTNAVYRATGMAPVTFRPPYGSFTQRQMTMLRDRRNMPSVLWSVDPLDWRRPGSSTIANRILRAIAPGAIVLVHDIHPGTIDAVPQILEGMADRGYSPVTISDLLGWPNWSTLRFRPKG